MCLGFSKSQGGFKARLDPAVLWGLGALEFHPSLPAVCLMMPNLYPVQSTFSGTLWLSQPSTGQHIIWRGLWDLCDQPHPLCDHVPRPLYLLSGPVALPFSASKGAGSRGTPCCLLLLSAVKPVSLVTHSCCTCFSEFEVFSGTWHMLYQSQDCWRVEILLCSM